MVIIMVKIVRFHLYRDQWPKEYKITYFYFAETKLDNNNKNKKMSSINPWSVNNIQEFWFLTCPECSFKTKEENKFQDHAVKNHPQSFELFRDDNKEFEDKLKIVDVEDEASDQGNILTGIDNKTVVK